MGRIKLTVSYDGRSFCGFQEQKNGISIQGKLQGALKAVYDRDIKVTASGRTDAGVSAKGQVVHFDGDDRVPMDKLPIVLNRYLPKEISVVKAQKVSDKFNARFSAKKKTYVYRIYNAKTANPLDPFCSFFPGKIDIDKMKEGAKLLIGEHDFKCFMASGSNIKDTVRIIYDAKVVKKQNIISIKICGNGFLYNMVRIIAGTLLYVGLGKISPNDITDIIEKRDRKKAGKTLPPNGLLLEKVVY